MEIRGRYFFIASKDSGFVFDARGSDPVTAGTEVKFYKKNGSKTQQWYFDAVKSTIHSRSNPALCITESSSCSNNHVVVDTYRAGDKKQTFTWDKERSIIYSNQYPNKRLHASSHSYAEGNFVDLYDVADQYGKLFLEFQPKDYFYISSKLDGRVLDVFGGSTTPGTRVIVHGKRELSTENPFNQLWFEDSDGNLRSKLNESVVLDAIDGYLRLGSSSDVTKWTYWSIQGEYIVNALNNDEVLQVGNDCGSKDDVVVGRKTGKTNQQWTVRSFPEV